jgi:hypothetical protein
MKPIVITEKMAVLFDHFKPNNTFFCNANSELFYQLVLHLQNKLLL